MAEKGHTKRQYEGSATYTYKLKDASELLHFIASSEVEYGVQCSMIKESKSTAAVSSAVKSITSPNSSALKNEYKALVDPSPPVHHKEFLVHSSLVNTLFEDRPGGGNVHRDVAYLRVSSPGRAFEPYDKEKNKLAITLSAYLKLLNFFKSEYHLVENRMESDYKNMLEKKQWLPLGPTISFRGAANIEFKLILDHSNAFNLELVIVRKFDYGGKRSIYLQYTDASMGRISLPGTVMVELSRDLPYISSLLDGEYKEAMDVKRSRQ